MRVNNESPSSNLKYLILKQKLLLGNPTDFCDLMNINELSMNGIVIYYSCHGWKHRTCGINISNQLDWANSAPTYPHTGHHSRNMF